MVNKCVETINKGGTKVVTIGNEIKGFPNSHDMHTDYLGKAINGSLSSYMVGLVRRKLCGEAQSIYIH